MADKTTWRPLRSFADGDWVESKDQSLEGIRLIQTGNVGDGIFKDRAEKARYISEATFKRLRCTEIFEGDCLISRLPDPVGRSCILPETGERMITAVDCTIVRFKPNVLLPEFFNLYSQSVDYISTVAKECTGTTRNRISRSNLALTPIPVPPLAEQQRIVRLLERRVCGPRHRQSQRRKEPPKRPRPLRKPPAIRLHPARRGMGGEAAWRTLPNQLRLHGIRFR